MRVYINDRPCDVTDGADVLTAVRIADAALAERLVAGEAYVTDGRAIPIESNQALTSGAILRVVVRSRRSTDADA